jgi:hypothetical protein
MDLALKGKRALVTGFDVDQTSRYLGINDLVLSSKF